MSKKYPVGTCLSRRLLGPKFELFSPLAWADHIRAMEEIPAISVRVPRVKKVKLPHNVDEATKRCLSCGKKPRNAVAVCAGPAKPEAVAATN